jgi:hypothetical protein
MLRLAIVLCVLAGALLSPAGASAVTADLTPPTLVDFSLSPATVDVGDADAANRTVTATIHATDDLSGWAGSGACIFFGSPVTPAGTVQSFAVCSGVSNTGTDADRTMTIKGVIPQYAYPGEWTTGGLTLTDRAGNARSYSAADLEAMGAPTSFTAVDSDAPDVSCESPDSLWHAGNVSLTCTASDPGAGLVDAADASFTLTTGVADGDENANASTDTRTVCDRSNNCVAVGPIAGIKVDRKKPTITVVAPTSDRVDPDSTVVADYSCVDGGSGLASSSGCAGDVANGAAVDTTAGQHTFTVSASDAVGNTATKSVTYTAALPDGDGDGVADATDNCPSDANPGQADLDADGQGDACDGDIDGDGVANGGDAFPRDPAETTDTDSDGIGDNADAFPNDATESADTDGDGVGDNSDLFPRDATESVDSDRDGVGDKADNCPTDANAGQVDTDKDGKGDACDPVVPAPAPVTNPAPPADSGKPTATPPVHHPGECKSGVLLFTLNAKRGRVVSAVLYLNGKRSQSKRGRSVSSLTLGAPPVGAFEVKIVTRLSTGTTRTSTHRFTGLACGHAKVTTVVERRSSKVARKHSKTHNRRNRPASA